MAGGNYNFIVQLTDRITAPAKKVQQAFQKSFSNAQRLNNAVNKLPLSIADLRGEMVALEHRKTFAKTEAEIKRVNKIIGKTQKELQRLENLPPKSFINRLNEIPKALMGISLKDIGIAYLARSAVRFTKESAKLFDVQAKAEAQLRASLESTGYAAGRTFNQLTKQASELQKKTTFGDEAIIKAQSVLLTFKQVRGEVYDKALPAIIDLSAKMETDLQSSVLQVGKALNDPILGLTTLRRSGIQFTDEQEKRIKELVEAGKLYEAQMMIINELQGQFGGSAEAAALAGLGPMQQLSNMWGDLREKMGGYVLSNVNRLVPTLKKNIEWIDRNSSSIKKLAQITAIGGVGFITYKIATSGAASALKFFKTQTTIAGLGTKLLTGGVRGLTVAWKELKRVTKANVFGAVASTAMMAITAFTAFRKRVDETSVAVKRAGDLGATYYTQEKTWLDRYFEKLEKTNEKSKERIDLVDELMKRYPSLNSELATELKNTNNLAAAKSVLIEQIQREAITKGMEDILKEKADEFAQLELDAVQSKMNEESIIDNYGREKYEKNKKYLEDALRGDIKVPMYDEIIGEFAVVDRKLNEAKEVTRDAETKRDNAKKKLDKLKTALNKSDNYLPGKIGGDTDPLGNPLGDPQKQLDTITGGGKSIKNITVNVESLIGVNNNMFQQGQSPEEADDFITKLSNALQLVLNDVNYTE
jgi:hypothetical protein